MVDFTKLEQEITNSLSKVTDLESLKECRIKYLGKKGEISLLMKELTNLSSEDRKKQAEILNTLKNKILSLIEDKTEELNDRNLNEKLTSETLDVTLPVSSSLGSIHPITQVIEEVVTIFGDLDFYVAEGPEVETDYNNFTALNTCLLLHI